MRFRAAPLFFVPVLLLTSACDVPLLDDGPEPPADALASSLASGKVAGVTFKDRSPTAVTKSLQALTARMGPAKAKVEVGKVETDGDEGSITLHWAWDLSGNSWAYDTRADLSRSSQTGDTWQVAWSPKLVEPSLAPGEVLDATPVRAARGEITGAGGQVVVTDRPVLRFGIDRSQVQATQAPKSAKALADLLGIDAKRFVKQVTAAGPKAFIEGLVIRRGEVSAEVESSYRGIDGAVALDGTLPLAPARGFAGPILGSVGPVTAEIVKKSGGKYAAGDVAGLSGLQSRYDDQLAGANGVVIEAVKPDSPGRELHRADPVPGKALGTTLDVRLQKLAEGALADVGPASALVAIRPSTGDILAAASGPGSKGYNTATFGQYAPGSTFKVVSSLALLRSGMKPGSTVHCTPTTTVNGKRFKNYSDYPGSEIGDIALRAAVANSCNTAFINARTRLKESELSEAAAALGLGIDHDLGFPAYFGQVPPPAGETEAAADMIGQGKVLASPMSMAAVLSSVVAGHAVLPRLLPGQKTEEARPGKALTAAEAGQLRALLRGVVENGSGRFLADLPGAPVLAKTGTAEFGDESPPRTHV